MLSNPSFWPQPLIMVLVPLSVLFSVLSALFERGGHIRIRHWANQAGDAIGSLYSSRSRFEALRYLLTLISRIFLVSLAVLTARAVGLDASLSPTSRVLFVLGAATAYLVLVEWTTRYLVRRHAERALEALTPVYRVLYFLMLPAIWLVRPLFTFAEQVDEEDDEEASEEEIDAFIDVGRREGILEPEEEEMVRSVVDFGDTQVRSVMTPRVEINSASVASTPGELSEKFFATRNSRLPLFRGSIDDIVGILHIRDLFEAMSAHGQEVPEAALIELCQQPLYIPESKPLRDSLEELKARRRHMAIVVDEYGGVAGLITIEDLVEEIVGEIRDEHEETEIHETLDDGRWRLNGRTHLEDFKDVVGLDIELDELPYETLSGLICGHLGYVPKKGELVLSHGLEMQIEEADERRVIQVEVSRRHKTGAFAAVGDL